MISESDIILKLKTSKIFESDLIIRGQSIKDIGEIEVINGTLGINNSVIENLGKLIEIKRDFWISANTEYSRLVSLDNLEIVGGDLNLRYSNIKDLGNLKRVGGKLNLRDTLVSNLGKLNFVGGDLFLPNRFKDSEDIKSIRIEGVLKFWKDDDKYIRPISNNELGLIKSNRFIPKWIENNKKSLNELDFDNNEQRKFYIEFKNQFLNGRYIDIEGNDYYAYYLQNDLKENYFDEVDVVLNLFENLKVHYPKTKKYTNHIITSKLESIDNYSKAWELISSRSSLIIETVMDYEKKIGENLVNGSIIEKLGGYNHLTDFGQRNIKKIIPFVDEVLKSNLKIKNKSFFDQFFKNNEPISKRASFYKKYYLSNAEYNHYRRIDETQEKLNYIRAIPHIVEKAIYSQCKQILKIAEDLYRKSIGMPKVGEGWISETELFYKIADYFNDIIVLNHASPKWLGRQHLDVFIPKYKIGIEYQGAQHYQPIDFFGGQIAFEKTVERDVRKKQLCDKNGCKLIYVNPGYQISEILNEIKEIISLSTSPNKSTSFE